MEKAQRHADSFKRGEISYDEWVRLDAALWIGKSKSAVLASLSASPIREGARELVGWFTSKNIPCIAISTGLSVFLDPFLKELGFSYVACNELYFENDIFQVKNKINVAEHDKGRVLKECLEKFAVKAENVVAFGDGSADVPMLKETALGIAVFPSNPTVEAAAKHVVRAEPIDSAISVIEAHFCV